MPVKLKNQKDRNSDEIFQFLKKYFIQEFEISEDRILPETNLYQDLELDSIDAFNIAGMIEMKMDIEIEDDDLKKIVTIQDIVDHIVQNLAPDSMLPSSAGQLQ
ncbi:MAG: acyl carrier protein [Deltaproteobacteria bacterium]|nr:MAG: acyl carrier protein [Deltaproteobacteria bacterium]